MNRKLVGLLIVLIFSICCAGFAFAENNTVEDIETDNESVETDDLSNYILPVSINNGKIEFNDGFTGFSLDSSKEKITIDDTFSVGGFSNTNTENLVKLAIIEAYKQGRENDLTGIISKIVDGNMDTSDSVIKEVAGSSDNIGESAVVNIDNSTEATFTFELLKSTNDEKSDCLAYKVSMTVINLPDTVADSDDDKNNNEDTLASDDNDKTGTDDSDKSDDNDKTSAEDSEKSDSDDTQKQSNDSDKKTDENSNSDDKKAATNNDSSKKDDESANKNKTTVKQTNTTIVKNTTTVIENNTTIVHNNVKEVNNTTAPENNTVTNLLKSGNAILILVIVIVVAVIAVVIMKRKE